MIESDLAELVDDDRCVRKLPLEQAIEHCGLAGAEKAGQHRKRNGRWHRRAMARRHCGSVLGVICSGVFAAGFTLAPAVAAAALSLPGGGLPGEGFVALAAAAGLGGAAAAGVGVWGRSAAWGARWGGGLCGPAT